MALTLSRRPIAGPRERSVVPACLQPRAPLHYEIRDDNERRLPPTLAGYKLRRGKTYHLKVRTQEKAPQNWSLRLLAPRSLLEPAVPDEIEGEARVVTFHTSSAPAGEPWNWFRSQVTSLPVHLDFADGREPFRFSIPIILLATRMRWIAYLFLTALLTAASQAFFREGLTLPGPSHLAMTAGAWALIVLAFSAADQWKFYRQAQRHLADRRRALGDNSR
jgi:hypothetical protein